MRCCAPYHLAYTATAVDRQWFLSECMKHIDDEYNFNENDEVGDDENDEAFRDGELQA